MTESEPLYALDDWVYFNAKTGEVREHFGKILKVLPKNEKIVFTELIEHEDLVVEYETLMNKLYGTMTYRVHRDSRDREALGANVGRLRGRLGSVDEKYEQRLVTIRDVGYRWDSVKAFEAQEGDYED